MTGGGDVSVQSSGLSINLVTKSGSNVFKGTAARRPTRTTRCRAANVTREMFYSGTAGSPVRQPDQEDLELLGRVRRPDQAEPLWWWAAADKQDINAGVINFFDPGAGAFCEQPDRGAARPAR